MPLQLKPFSRFLVYSFFFFGLIINYSCQEKALLEELELATNTDKTPGSSTLKRSSQFENRFDVLESRMQWVSYLSAQILCQHEDAQTEIVELLQLQGSNAIGLDQLLVDGDDTPRFRELFLSRASYHLGNIDGSEQFFPEPSHNQPIPPSSRQNNLTYLQSYIEFLTVDNCLELVFINALAVDRESHYYSTAHPLTLADHNYGYAVAYIDNGLIGVGQDANFGERLEVEETTVNPDVAFSGNKIILCRPSRTQESPECDYSEWERIDFTLFLNQ